MRNAPPERGAFVEGLVGAVHLMVKTRHIAALDGLGGLGGVDGRRPLHRVGSIRALAGDTADRDSLVDDFTQRICSGRPSDLLRL